MKTKENDQLEKELTENVHFIINNEILNELKTYKEILKERKKARSMISISKLKDICVIAYPQFNKRYELSLNITTKIFKDNINMIELVSCFAVIMSYRNINYNYNKLFIKYKKNIDKFSKKHKFDKSYISDKIVVYEEEFNQFLHSREVPWFEGEASDSKIKKTFNFLLGKFFMSDFVCSVFLNILISNIIIDS